MNFSKFSGSGICRAKLFLYANVAMSVAIFKDTDWMDDKGGYTRPSSRSFSVTDSARL